MTRPEIEPRSLGPLANTLTAMKTNAYWTGLVFMNKHIQLDVLANHNPRNRPANVCTLESPNVP